MHTQHALLTLAERNAHLMHVAVRAGDELYSPEMRLLRQCHDAVAIFNGYTIGQVSLEYALALLETGGDSARADGVVARALDFQDLSRDSATYGNFRWMAHWNEVRDRNAVVFMLPNFFYLWQRHRSKLSPETGRRMEAMFPLARIGVDKHGARWQYTNIFLLRILAWLMLGKIMGDQALVRHAADQWDVWLRGTSQGGWLEYNSPCYTAVNLYTLAGLWSECGDESWRRSIGRVLECLYAEFAANLHKGSACLSGPMSRGYPSDYLFGTGLSAVVAYQQFGLWHSGEWDTNGGATPFIVNFAIQTYEVPESIRRAFDSLDSPYTVRAAIPEAKALSMNYLHPKFTVGSACSARLHPQATPVVVCRATQRKRRTVVLRLSPASGAEVLCSQRDSRVLGWVQLAPPVKDGLPASGGQAWAGATWLLGPWRHLERVNVNGSAWNGGDLTFDGRICIALETEGVQVGLKMLALPGPQSIEMGIREKELVLSARLPQPEPPSTGGMSFLLEVSDASQQGFGEFLKALSAQELLVEHNEVVIRAGAGPEALTLDIASLRQTLQQPDAAVFQVLHESPLLTLRRGELCPGG